VARALRDLQGCGRELCVRINTLASGFGADDLAALPLASLDSVMAPKVESPAELHALDALLRKLEREQDVQRPRELVVMLETPRGILQALPIAEACTRTTALFFGSGDFTAATGAAITANALLFARSAVSAAAGALASRRSMRPTSWTCATPMRPAPTRSTRASLASLARWCSIRRRSRSRTKCSRPTPAEVQRAERVVAGYREALAQGHGTALADGVFVAIDLVARPNACCAAPRWCGSATPDPSLPIGSHDLPRPTDPPAAQ
jgi:citrate lyase subunit beta/citryl-CoA lyase